MERILQLLLLVSRDHLSIHKCHHSSCISSYSKKSSGNPFPFLTHFPTSLNLFQDFSEGLYVLLPDLISVIIHFHWGRNIEVVKRTIAKLESDTFLPKDETENEFLKWAKVRTLLMYAPLLVSCFFLIFVWSVCVLLPGDTKTSIVPAIFPFDFEFGVGFGVVWVYQTLAEMYSVLVFITYSTFVSGMFFHASAQLKRLGYHLSKVKCMKLKVSKSQVRFP